MKSESLRIIDEAAVPRPWKWTDGTLLWNEKADHCVLQHGGTQWPITPEDRAAIETAMNHMPAVIKLIAACERRREALDARNAFGRRPYLREAANLDEAIQSAESDLDAALIAVHALGAQPSPDETWRSLARKIPMSEPMTHLHTFAGGHCCTAMATQDPALMEAVRKGLAAYGAGSAADADVRAILESFILLWVDPSNGSTLFLSDLARDIAVLVVALEANFPAQINSLLAEYQARDAALLREWTAAAGAPGYVKAAWIDRADAIANEYRDKLTAVGYPRNAALLPSTNPQEPSP